MRYVTNLVFGIAILGATPLLAEQWAVDMFETTDHDFGSVARGAKAEYEFVLSNIYVEDVHIANVRTSCGCTSATIKKPTLKTYEKGAIVAAINTRSFLGSKGATITVTFDKPFYAEVQLHVRTYIRSDVVLQPGSVELGEVEQGEAVDRVVTVTYAGRSDWQILDVLSDNPHLSGKIVETGRGGGQVSYELSVRLAKEAPVGYLDDHLMLVTNDHRSTRIPVPVGGRVLSGVSVSPASLFMGVVHPGQKVTKQLVVRGKKPFRILTISCPDKSFEFDTSAEKDAKTMHLIPVTFLAGADPGKITEKIQIQTDLGNSTPVASAFAVVAAE